jgi:hypothetical protein
LESEVNLIAEDMTVEELPNVLLSLVGIESFFGGKSLTNFGELALYSLSFGLFVFTGSDVGDELVETSHIGSIG